MKKVCFLIAYILIIKNCILLGQSSVVYHDEPTVPFTTALPVGSINGVLDVSPTGAAVYSIPLFISPGTAGMQPKLSISYNSQGGNGTMGIGFSISNLSAISRVPNDFYHDGKVKEINFINDKFALDGNRLIAVNGNYGSNETIYGTECETFSKITSYGSYNSGVDWFEVITKDGNILEYGRTSDSKLKLSGGSPALSWRLNKITDQNGNYIEYKYKDQNSESYLESIKYTGNSITNLLPYNEINFEYQLRSDIGTSYIAGLEVKQSVLLSSIKVISEDTQIKEYKFVYKKSDAEHDVNSRLIEIIEYGLNSSYYNSTKINWGESTSQYTTENPNHTHNDKAGCITVDINGDGKTDRFIYGSDFWEAYLNDESNTYFTGIFPYDIKTDQIRTGDFNGDGKTDFVFTSKDKINDSYKTGAYISYGVGFEFETVADDSYNFTIELYTGDFNGDGLSDIFVKRKDISSNDPEFWVYSYYYSNNVLEGLQLRYSGNIESWGDILKLTDYNGDGRTDIMIVDDYNCIIYTIDNDGGTTSTLTQLYSSGFPTKWHRIYWGDFNGDGKRDLLTYIIDTDEWKIVFSTGTSFTWPAITVPLQNVDPNGNLNYNYFIADFNGDGKDDILEVYKVDTKANTAYMNLFISKGNGEFIKEENIFVDTNIVEGFLHIGDYNGDGKMDVYYNTDNAADPICYVYFHKDEQKKLVRTITNGFNQTSEIEYKPLTYTSDNFYRKYSLESSFPLFDYQGAFHAVKSVKTPDGIGGYTLTKYEYVGARVHRQGKGFLGFTNIVSYNEIKNLKTVLTYENNARYFNISLVNALNTTFLNDNISQTFNTNSIRDCGNGRFFSYTSQTGTIDYLNNITTTTDYLYDESGNVKKVTVNYGGDAVFITENLYDNFGSDYDNKIIYSKITKTYTNEPSYIRDINYYYDSRGNLIYKISDKDKDKAVRTDYPGINSYGLPTSVATSASGLDTRYNSFTYDDKYRFVSSTTNALEHTVSKAYDGATGNVLTETDINGLSTVNKYDSFGRLESTTTPLGNKSTIAYSWDEQGALENSVYYIVTEKPGKPSVKVYYDGLGRELQSETEGLNGKALVKQKFNVKGQLYRRSYPYYEGDIVKWKTFYYDYNNGRIESENDNGITTSYAYEERETTITNPAGQKTTKTINALGDVISVIGNDDEEVKYTYHSSGQVRKIEASGSIVQISYDDYGMQNTLSDPDAGISSYTYNAFGELMSQTNANNVNISMKYDILGRISTKTDPDGTTTYNYVESGNGLEQLLSVSSPNGTGQIYQYDSYGRITGFTDHISNTDYSTFYTYDSYNNVIKQKYPSGFEIMYKYDKGYLKQVVRCDNEKLIWQMDSQTALDQPAQITLGNNYITNYGYDDYEFLESINTFTYEYVQSFVYHFDPESGNLEYRKDAKRNLTETFGYDKLNRLTSIQLNNNTPCSIVYNPNGNIESKYDVGTYGYDGTKIHAVNSISNNTGTISTQQQDIKYTPFNKACKITEGAYQLQITYGPDEQRKIASIYNNESADALAVILRKYYSVNYEKEVRTKGGITRQYHYINASNGLIAVYIIDNDNAGTMYYVLKDHLGSITALADDNGNIVEEYSYDAWGRRRNPADWTYNNVAIPQYLNRGFTGHEHLDIFGLIDMNGRMYDPLLSRFLSPDNYVQAPGCNQNYNRYSYCFNNPLIYTDPEGEYGMLVGAIIGMAINQIIYAYDVSQSPGGFDNWDWSIFAVVSLEGAAQGAFSWGIGEFCNELPFGESIGGLAGRELTRASLHGLENAFFASANGSDVEQAFLVGSVSSLTASGFTAYGEYGNGIGASIASSIPGQVTFSALAGGLTAVACEGDFIEGAAQGALIALGNHALHQLELKQQPKNNNITVEEYLKKLSSKMRPGETITSKEIVREMPNLKNVSYAVDKLTRTKNGFKVERSFLGRPFIPKDAEITLKQIRWQKSSETVYEIKMNFSFNGYNKIYINNNAYRTIYSDYNRPEGIWKGGAW